ncbi:MAG TPA: TetR/AcrR family transcriptional regulator [Mycobacteriales bacterium]|nr:TetR/AcrR family transcriptional regulator [Mycobacteriales bacterium]
MTPQRHKPEVKPGAAGRRDEPAVLPAGVAEAVRESVLAVGVRRTTLTDVARRAGVSRMTLYRMVPDVEALILSVMTSDFAAVLSDAEARVARRRSARARLVAMTADITRRLPDEPLFRRVIEVDPDLLLPYLTERVGSTQRLAIEHVERVIRDGHADGSVRPGDPAVMATALLVAVAPFVISARLLEDLGRDAVVDEMAAGLDGWLKP